MQYVLGNMLNGGGGLNADGLALDLQFALDKTMTARKGPNPVFTRASSGTFVGSNGLIQSAATNIPRFDHTAAGVCRGLLIEESRTNVALYSNAIVVNQGWNSPITVTTSGTAPDGSSSYEISEITSSSQQIITNNGGTGSIAATSITSGTTYTGSIFLKKVTGSIDWVQITFAGAGFGPTQYANINISNGTIGNSSGGTARVEAYANGWYRVSWTAVAIMTITTTNIILGFIQNTNGTARLPSYAGSPANKFLAAMAQFETGSFATSYIPTTTGSVVRSADVCSITGANFTSFYNQSEGTVYSSFQRSNSNDNLRVLSVSTGASSNSTQWFKSGSNEFLQNFSPTGSYSLTLSASSLNNIKIAQAMKSGDHAASMNGATPVTSTGVGLIAPDRLIIGANQTGAFSLMNGTIDAIRYYKKRLPNSKLVALTT